MVTFELDSERGVLFAHLSGPLRSKDFDAMAASVDPFIEGHGSLTGILLEVGKFLGWEDLGAAVRHFRFVRDHHHQVRRVAVVTDSLLGDAAEHIAAHFVAAEIKHFPEGESVAARNWIVAP